MGYMLEGIRLEEVQKALLFELVEAARKIPREKRQPFLAIQFTGFNQARVFHPGSANGMEAYMGDIDLLADARLIRFSSVRCEGPKREFDVTPLGFEYYRRIIEQTTDPISRVEASIRAYLDADGFKLRHPEAYNKWTEAESIVWSDNSEQQLTVIGHLCREALQEFTNKLVERIRPSEVDENRAHIENRIRAVLANQGNQLGTTERPFLDALVRYWRTVSDIVQRQEHGSQREVSLLTGEDGRRVVFQTAVVMFEIDRALARDTLDGR
jgi:BMFP domain-containing protein YqiC